MFETFVVKCVVRAKKPAGESVSPAVKNAEPA